jgi:hypothetical protein
LFRYGTCIIDLDTEIPGGAFDFGVVEQKLNGAEISSAAVDQGFSPLAGEGSDAIATNSSG